MDMMVPKESLPFVHGASNNREVGGLSNSTSNLTLTIKILRDFWFTLPDTSDRLSQTNFYEDSYKSHCSAYFDSIFSPFCEKN